MRLTLAYALALAGALIAVHFCAPAQARDLGQYSQVDPKTRACFTSARDAYGTNCCDTSDGSRVEDPDWGQNADGSYRVVVDGEKRPVEPSQVVQKPCTRYAVIW